MMKKAWLVPISMLLFAILLAGCSTAESQGGNGSGDGPSNENNLPQEEVIAEIDRITADINSGAITEEEGVEQLQSVIPKPHRYPSRNIEYVIAWGEGGGSDRYARSISREAEKIMGVRLVPNNMPGGAGEVALAYALSQPSDGYTLYGAITSQVINEALGEQPYSFTEDTTFIIRNQGATEVFWVRDDSEFETWDDVVAAEENSPGYVKITGVGGIGDDQLRVNEINEQLGLNMTYIPSNASGERVASLLGGHVHMLHETAGAVADLYAAGEIRPILVPSDEPFEGIDAQTTGELGLNISVGRWRGTNAPGQLEPEVQQYLHNVFYAASNMPDYLQYEEESWLHIADGYLNSEDYEKSAKEEMNTLQTMLKEMGYLE
ncbi:tripartite tricarboxylate transporter substrate binding protein [Bacillus sp. FJAT-45350]|uniref:tripartite tricarboxylate transporter substrate binding protein n=1 Tax=Bacillus sp. FJAT-45350 TaxID=2011014 RepID=UPI000BB99339|nr:tripartite tricarboxylate transporter substrate-binding protein [Bacillus sp. FJAT-45350]